ncbi:MAG: hypothetical protein MK008_14925 [Bdellovibrionales bacterium]|nr:hypothetical protein [Bdellovibrionales bacterium]
MSILLSFLLTSFTAQACPQVDGVYTCTDQDEVYELIVTQTVENGVSVYEIIDDETKEQPFDLKFITDNVTRTQEEPLVDDETGRQIGMMIVTKRAACSNENSLNFNLDMTMKVMGMEMQNLFSGDLIAEDANNFVVEAVEVNVEANGEKTTKESRSVCVKK